MKVKKFEESDTRHYMKDYQWIKSALIFEEGDRKMCVFSDFDYELSMALLKCYIDGKYEKVTEDL